MYLRLLSTQISTKLLNTMAIDIVKMKNAFNISSVAGKVEGQPLLLSPHELLDKEGATNNAPLVESNIVVACDEQRNVLLNQAFRSCDIHYL